MNGHDYFMSLSKIGKLWQFCYFTTFYGLNGSHIVVTIATLHPIIFNNIRWTPKDKYGPKHHYYVCGIKQKNNGKLRIFFLAETILDAILNI